MDFQEEMDKYEREIVKALYDNEMLLRRNGKNAISEYNKDRIRKSMQAVIRELKVVNI